MNHTKQILNFVKMHGCGNDYIYIDCLDQMVVEDPAALAVRLSDRHFSIGGDGIVLICPPAKNEAGTPTSDATMRMFNIDGSEGKMCGNAIRCVGKYLHDIRGIEKDELFIDTKSGIKHLFLTIEDGEMTKARVNMGKAELIPEKIPVRLDGTSVINRKIPIAGGEYAITCVSMGNPHCVVFGGDPNLLDLPRLGPKFEFDPLFPERVNTEFIECIDAHTLKMRVWERGSGETMACGTGACASSMAAVLNGYCPDEEPICVRLLGGELSICCEKDGTVWMTGGAEIAFRGYVEL